MSYILPAARRCYPTLGLQRHSLGSGQATWGHPPARMVNGGPKLETARLTWVVEPQCSQDSPLAVPGADLKVCVERSGFDAVGLSNIRPKGCNAGV